MTNNTRTQAAIEKIIDLFKSDKLPEKVALATFPADDTPSAHWSLRNRLLMLLGGTNDARGYRQWQSVGRYVKGNETSRIDILSPRIVKKTKKNAKGEDEETPICIGFLSVPVFAVEQTAGEPLPESKMVIPSELPLLTKAREWGITLKAVPENAEFYGQCFVTGDHIDLASPEEKVFFHELAHAAHARVLDRPLKGIQDPHQEVVAELSAAVLGQIVGRSTKNTLGNSYEYIQRYSKKAGNDVERMCLSVLREVGQVVDLILDRKSDEE